MPGRPSSNARRVMSSASRMRLCTLRSSTAHAMSLVVSRSVTRDPFAAVATTPLLDRADRTAGRDALDDSPRALSRAHDDPRERTPSRAKRPRASTSRRNSVSSATSPTPHLSNRTPQVNQPPGFDVDSMRNVIKREFAAISTSQGEIIRARRADEHRECARSRLNSAGSARMLSTSETILQSSELPRGFVAARRRSLSLSDAQMIEWEEGQRLS